MHRFYVIELSINQWDKNDPLNAGLVNFGVCDQRPIYANECSKVYIRRNGYVWEIRSGKNMANLKKHSYIKEIQQPPCLEMLPQPNFENEDEETEYFSYESN